MIPPINGKIIATFYFVFHRAEASSIDKKDDGSEKPSDGQGLELKRKIGLFSGISLIVGNMIGNNKTLYVYFKQTNALNDYILRSIF